MLIAREDQTLPLLDRMVLRTHLWACDACPRFEKQVLLMQNGMKQWRNYTTSDEK